VVAGAVDDGDVVGGAVGGVVDGGGLVVGGDGRRVIGGLGAGTVTLVVRVGRPVVCGGSATMVEAVVVVTGLSGGSGTRSAVVVVEASPGAVEVGVVVTAGCSRPERTPRNVMAPAATSAATARPPSAA